VLARGIRLSRVTSAHRNVARPLFPQRLGHYLAVWTSLTGALAFFGESHGRASRGGQSVIAADVTERHQCGPPRPMTQRLLLLPAAPPRRATHCCRANAQEGESHWLGDGDGACMSGGRYDAHLCHDEGCDREPLPSHCRCPSLISGCARQRCPLCAGRGDG
jgi:hypothetical protein